MGQGPWDAENASLECCYAGDAEYAVSLRDTSASLAVSPRDAGPGSHVQYAGYAVPFLFHFGTAFSGFSISGANKLPPRL